MHWFKVVLIMIFAVEIGWIGALVGRNRKPITKREACISAVVYSMIIFGIFAFL